jgi:uncharacterized protein YjbI with pentapeptide repeats
MFLSTFPTSIVAIILQQLNIDELLNFRLIEKTSKDKIDNVLQDAKLVFSILARLSLSNKAEENKVLAFIQHLQRLSLYQTLLETSNKNYYQEICYAMLADDISIIDEKKFSTACHGLLKSGELNENEQAYVCALATFFSQMSVVWLLAYVEIQPAFNTKLPMGYFNTAKLSLAHKSVVISLRSCNLTHANFSYAFINKSDLSTSYLHKSISEWTNFFDCNLSEVNFSHASLVEATLNNCQLHRCNFRFANLTKTKFYCHAALCTTNVDFSYANLSGAILEGNYADIDFSGADLSGATLYSAHFMGVTFSTKTKFNNVDFIQFTLHSADTEIIQKLAQIKTWQVKGDIPAFKTAIANNIIRTVDKHISQGRMPRSSAIDLLSTIKCNDFFTNGFDQKTQQAYAGSLFNRPDLFQQAIDRLHADMGPSGDRRFDAYQSKP